MRRYVYCYYCERYLIALGQESRCEICCSETASLSQSGMLHYDTAQRLTAQAAYRKAQELAAV